MLLLSQSCMARLQLDTALSSGDAAACSAACFSSACFQPAARTWVFACLTRLACDCRDFVFVTLSVLLVQKAVRAAGRVY